MRNRVVKRILRRPEAHNDVEKNGELSHEKGEESSADNAPSIQPSTPLEVSTYLESRKELTESTIYETSQNHECYTSRKTTLKSLDKYNDSTMYGITKKDEKRLVQAEVHRLVNEAKAGQDACLLNTNGLFDASTSVAYEEVARVVDQLLCAMDIITVDNASISFQHCVNGIEDTNLVHRIAHGNLTERFSMDRTRVQGSGPKPLDPPDRNLAIYHLLVDYITASIAKLLHGTASSGDLNNNVFSCLATCTVKLKVLIQNLENNAVSCLNSCEDALEQTKKSWRGKQTLLIKVKPMGGENFKDIDPIQTETRASTRYHEQKTLVMRRVRSLVLHVLHDLQQTENEDQRQGCFELHSAIFKASVDSEQTVLYNDREGEIAASSGKFYVKEAFTALHFAVNNAMAIESTRGRPSSSNNTNEQHATTISYEWVNAGRDTCDSVQTLESTNADEILSVIVPLALSSPMAASDIFNLVSVAESGGSEDDPVRQCEQPPSELRAAFTVTTAAWQRRRQERYERDESARGVMTLQDSPIRFGIRAGTDNLMKRALSKPANAALSRKPELARIEQDKIKQYKQYQEDKSAMRTWVIDEKTITLRCRTYVCAVMTIATLVVCGGIAVPFVVRNRVPGVDPFQITLFSWIIAGTIIVTAKGRYVNEWPWHEFLHGLVICRSVKEVCDASGIDAQTVIMYLLLNEWKTILVARGPYNGMFLRVASEDGDGFSINEPVLMSTMVASGYIILKVLDLYGEHLVCLDTRHGNDAVYLRTRQQYLAWSNWAERPDAKSEGHSGTDGIKSMEQNSKDFVENGDSVKMLSYRSIRISRIYGVYLESCSFG